MRLIESRLFVALCAIVIVTRAAGFVHLSLDLDEGAYLLMVRDLFSGHLPYTLTWDWKPPGAYVVWAPFALIFGVSSVALRVGADIAVIATATAIFRIARAIVPESRPAAIIAASLYASMTLDSGGLASNLELMGAPFVAWALAIAIRRRDLAATAAAGLLLGTALMIKESLAIDVGFAFACIAWYRRGRPETIAVTVAAMLFPALLAVGIYAPTGMLGLLVDATISAPLRHAATAAHELIPAYFWRRALLAFLPASLLPAIMAFASREARARWSMHRRELVAIVIWLALDLAAFAAIHEYFEHQLIPAMLPASLLFGIIVALEFDRMRSIATALLIGVLAIGAHAFGPDSRALDIVVQRIVHHDPNAGDETSELANVLRTERLADGKLFVVDDIPLFYLLANVWAPTRYAFTPFLYDKRQRAVTGVDTIAEVRRVFATNPSVVIRDAGINEDPELRTMIDSRLRAAYREIYHVNHRMIFVRRKT